MWSRNPRRWHDPGHALRFPSMGVQSPALRRSQYLGVPLQRAPNALEPVHFREDFQRADGFSRRHQELTRFVSGTSRLSELAGARSRQHRSDDDARDG
jgi:hypothetical protein